MPVKIDFPGPRWRPGPFARLDLTWEDDGQLLATVEMDITTRRLHFGGVQNWFVCPVCRGRAKKLYAVGWEECGRRQARLESRRCLELVCERQYRKAPRPQWLR